MQTLVDRTVFEYQLQILFVKCRLFVISMKGSNSSVKSVRSQLEDSRNVLLVQGLLDYIDHARPTRLQTDKQQSRNV